MDKQTKESLKLVAIYAQAKLLVDRHQYHKDFPDQPSLGPDMAHDNLPAGAIEQAGGMAEVLKMRAAAIEIIFRYIDSMENENNLN